MKVLVTGCKGQLGYELQRSIPPFIQKTVTFIPMDIKQLNITDAKAVDKTIALHKPDWVINSAAYTAVDKAESEPLLAEAINAEGAKNIANACLKQQAKMIQISTDFIFSGDQSTPYHSNATASPLNVYGATKLAGEHYVQQILPDNSLIIRTSWLYSAQGNNFVKTMLNLMQSRHELNVVADQIGTPTWAKTLSDLCWRYITKHPQLTGVYHCSDNGIASWYDFAVIIQEKALQLGLLNKRIAIKPIPSIDYPTPAARPHYSVMDKVATESQLRLTFPHWQHTLQRMLCELAHSPN